MFSNLNWWEIMGLALLGLFIFGPERLPKVISEGVRMLRGLREMARNATSDLSRELGTDVRLEDLHPKTFIRKHLLSEEDEAALKRPFDDMYSDVKKLSDDVNTTAKAAADQSTSYPQQPTYEQPPSYQQPPSYEQPPPSYQQPPQSYPPSQAYPPASYQSGQQYEQPVNPYLGQPSAGSYVDQPYTPRHESDSRRYDGDAT